MDKMVGLSFGKKKEATPSTASQQIQLTWPDDYVSVGADDQFVSVDHEDLYQGEHRKDVKNQGEKKRILFHPQVTVNVFGNNGSNSETTRAEGSEPSTTKPTNEKKTEESNDIVAELTAKLAALSQKVDKLSALASARGPRVECGLWNTSEARSWKYPSNDTKGRICFEKEFKSAPRVTTGMSSADVSKDSNFRVSVYPTEVDTKGFRINVKGWHDTVIYSCGVSWVAIGD
ncbi:hypothetical protein F5Y00DRAFT_130353 [Daldinia vernicosa]|uniref:uncharacterized protein n=1 Tax=Daldinia vernicosa TaxID=114800 RepID=UPI0020075278|nr:uncharacterized protein F5Y00DRAFT_130353 [Daldinia vernicosa]KAI0853030.1 hypothetical protein F5Y00DRAFT_130353 [Daldinia vernicosa]